MDINTVPRKIELLQYCRFHNSIYYLVCIYLLAIKHIFVIVPPDFKDLTHFLLEPALGLVLFLLWYRQSKMEHQSWLPPSNHFPSGCYSAAHICVRDLFILWSSVHESVNNRLHSGRCIISWWDVAVLVTLLVKCKVYVLRLSNGRGQRGPISISFHPDWRFRTTFPAINALNSKHTIIYFIDSSFISLNLKTSSFLSIDRFSFIEIGYYSLFKLMVSSNRHVDSDTLTVHLETFFFLFGANTSVARNILIIAVFHLLFLRATE